MTIKLSEQIRKARKALGLTQAEFAKRSGISVMSLRRYEASERSPSLRTIERMASAINLTPSEFLHFNPETKRSYFWMYDLDEKLKQAGYSISFDEDNMILWLNYPDGVLEVAENDLIDLDESTNSFLKFKLDELKHKYPDRFRRKRDGDSGNHTKAR